MTDSSRISSAQAADLLRDIEATERRAVETIGYREASPYLLVWGFVWLGAFGASHFLPAAGGTIWLVALAAGALVSAFVGWNQAKSAEPGLSHRIWLSIAIAWVFGLFVSSLLGLGPRQIAMFWVLMVMAIYMAMGLWVGRRFTVLGATIAMLACVVYFLAGEWFNLGLAVLGGAGLLLGGAWLRWHA